MIFKNRNINWFKRGVAISLVVLLSVLLSSIICLSQSDQYPKTKEEIKFGIVTFYNPRLMVLRYQPLMDALTKRTPHTYKLVFAKSYCEAVEKAMVRIIEDKAYIGSPELETQNLDKQLCGDCDEQ